jgi:GntR family transcriptional regulator
MNIIRTTPVADQVNQVLRERMLDGTYRAGARLPSESELSKEFGVSRATIRTVLARMEAEGLILRKQGDGTYVNERIQDVNTHLGGLWEFTRLIESSGYRASIESLSVDTRIASDIEAQELALEPGDTVMVLKRLFYADQQPVILATNAIPSNLIDPTTGPINSEIRISDFLQEYCHRKIAYAISEVSSSKIQGGIAELLDCPSGSLMLKIHITFYDRDNQALICGESYYNDSMLRLRLVQAWG